VKIPPDKAEHDEDEDEGNDSRGSAEHLGGGIGSSDGVLIFSPHRRG
jgi:hypothetical protein